MKKDRNCGMMPYPIYPTMDIPMPYGMPNNYMNTMPNNNMGYNTSNDQYTSLENRINNLENRVNNLENMLNSSNSVSYSNTKYNSSNYQMM